MTYDELLESTQKKKDEALGKLNKIYREKDSNLMSALAWAEVEKNPGRLSWLMLAEEFCKTLAENIGDFLEQTGDIDSIEAREIGDIYVAYENDDPDLYELLPVEAKLFEE